ncbi:MAG: MFS transporter [Gammaproteobacteria bacterium]
MNNPVDWKRFNPLIWLIGTAFALLQFTLQLSSAVIINVIMLDMHLTALTGGLLSGLFYIIYTTLQMPVGVLCDHFNPRPILSLSACICVLGCFIFASSHQLFGLYCGRALIALGSSFAFVCLTHLVREHYPKTLFTILIGTTETLSFMAAIFGIISLGAMVGHFGWRDFMYGAAGLSLICACLCWAYIPQYSQLSQNGRIDYKRILAVVTNIPLWLNGLFIGFTFLLVTVFGGLWAPPFLQIKLQCTLEQASNIDAIFILGVGISCPIFGYLANRVQSQKNLIITANFLSALLLLFIIYFPIHQIYVMAGLMLILGLISGSYILAYTFANELAPLNTLSTTAGFTNTLALVMTPILQPWIGHLLDLLHAGRHIELQDYQSALTILPVCILIAIFCISRIQLDVK